MVVCTKMAKGSQKMQTCNHKINKTWETKKIKNFWGKRTINGF